MASLVSLKTVICERLGCEYPVFGFTHYPQVAAEVTNAGGVGILGAGWGNDPRGPEPLRQRIRMVRDLVGDRPFGVDLILPASVPEHGSDDELRGQIPQEHQQFARTIKAEFKIPEPLHTSADPPLTRDYIRSMFQMLYEEDVKIFASGLGSPASMNQELHDHGMTVIGLVGRVRHAVRQVESGTDIIVAQGADSAGHTGTIGTMSLVPQVVDAVRALNPDIPVLAAGGIADGRQLVAALALGAAGVWTGTVWLPTFESGLHPILQEKLINANSDDTVHSNKRSGYTARFLRSMYDEVWRRKDAPRDALPMPLQGLAYGSIQQATEDYEMADWMSTPASQSVGLVRGRRSTHQVFDDLIDEARAVLDGNFGMV